MISMMNSIGVTHRTPADIEELSVYYSSQKPALETVPKKASFLTSK